MEGPALIRIAIVVPSRDTWRAEFGQCLMGCAAYTMTNLEGGSVNFMQVMGTCLDSQRSKLARDALASGATHIMWFDNDMTFPPDTILRLLARDKAIVGANYSLRQKPVRPTARRGDSYIYTDHMSSGLEASIGAGFGVMLTRADVFERMAAPWFNSGETDDGQTIGEDYYFCYRALSELDEPTWIDHDLSKMVGHVGSYIYTFEDSLGDRVETRLIKAGKLDDPGMDVPHIRYRSIVDLDGKYAPERLEAMRENYGRHWRQREDADEARILKALEAS